MIDTPFQSAFPVKPGATFDKQFVYSFADVPGADLADVVVRAQVRDGLSKSARLLAGLDLGSDLPATANGSRVTAVVDTEAATITIRLRLVAKDTAALPYEAEAYTEFDLVYPNGEDVDTLEEITLNVGGQSTREDA